MQNASLTIVGSGIKFLSHITTEAKVHIQQSDKVLYLVNEPAMKAWIQRNNPNTESLDNLYNQFEFRKDSYTAITNHILDTVYKKQHVCVVLYGHPTVFSQPALDAALQARKEGYPAKILPGISAEDCLFADLLINPGSCGCLSFEATDLLVHQRQIDPTCHVIIWQIAVTGILSHKKSYNVKAIKLLIDYLSKYYNLEHEVTLYTAAQYPQFEPSIQKFALKHLNHIQIPRLSTLYIPPSHLASYNKSILEFLENKN